MTAKERGFSAPKHLKESIKAALDVDSSSLMPHELAIAQDIVSNKTIYSEHIEWMQEYFSSVDIQFLLHGGDDAREWINKVNSPKTVVSSAFSGRSEWVYFVAGPYEDSPLADSLFTIDPKSETAYQWDGRWTDLGNICKVDIDRPGISEVDFTTATQVAEWIMDHPLSEKTIDIRTVDPVEFNIFRKAQYGLDYDMLDRVSDFIADDPDLVRERSTNAQKQVRDGSGRFSGNSTGSKNNSPSGSGNPLPPVSVGGGKTESSEEKSARLTKDFQKYTAELDSARDGEGSEVEDRINSTKVRATLEGSDNSPQIADQFMEEFKAGDEAKIDNKDQNNRPRTTFAEEAAYEPDPETTRPSDISKLPEASRAFVAIIDSDDHNAVLNLAVVAKSGGKIYAYIRMNSAWYYAPELVTKFQSTNPPYVVRLEDEAKIASVIEQIDAGDAEAAGSLEEAQNQGAENEQAVSAAMIAFSQTGETAYARDAVVLASLTGNQRLLTREVVLASDLGLLDARSVDDYGNVLLAAGVPGVADTPSDWAAVRRLRNYWLHGPGAAKIRWGMPGDWTRCVRHLAKYLGPRAKGWCQLRHKEAVGFYTGSKLNK